MNTTAEMARAQATRIAERRRGQAAADSSAADDSDSLDDAEGKGKLPVECPIGQEAGGAEERDRDLDRLARGNRNPHDGTGKQHDRDQQDRTARAGKRRAEPDDDPDGEQRRHAQGVPPRIRFDRPISERLQRRGAEHGSNHDRDRGGRERDVRRSTGDSAGYGADEQPLRRRPIDAPLAGVGHRACDPGEEKAQRGDRRCLVNREAANHHKGGHQEHTPDADRSDQRTGDEGDRHENQDRFNAHGR